MRNAVFCVLIATLRLLAKWLSHASTSSGPMLSGRAWIFKWKSDDRCCYFLKDRRWRNFGSISYEVVVILGIWGAVTTMRMGNFSGIKQRPCLGRLIERSKIMLFRNMGLWQNGLWGSYLEVGMESINKSLHIRVLTPDCKKLIWALMIILSERKTRAIRHQSWRFKGFSLVLRESGAGDMRL